MSRFIVCSFLLLGWVFYEMSGGADFVTPVAPVAVAEVDDKPAPRAASTVAVTARSKPEPTPVAVATVATVREPELVAEIATKPETTNLDRARTSLSQGLDLGSSLFPATESGQVLTLASLEQGATSLTTVAVEPVAPETTLTTSVVEPVADIRKVTGTRVNMRDGPGTIYPVIARVTSGHEVEVLDDSGTGWLRLRTLPGRQIGWISASLVSKAER